MCLLCGPSWLHVGVNIVNNFDYPTNGKNTWPNHRSSIIEKLWRNTKMELGATITLDILVQRKIGEMRVFHVLSHQILLSF